jgi:putative methionine-R-sulfoxide reductase with GAF domain
MLSGSVTITIPKIHSPPYLTMNNAEENSQVPCDEATFDWQALLTQVIADFGCVTGTLHRFDLTDQHLKLVAHQGIPEVLMPVVQSIPIGKGIAGAAAQTRQPVEMCNLQTDTSGVAKPGAKQTQVQGSLAVPVLDGERLCGTLGIGKMVPYEFSEEEKDRLLTIAAGLAQRLAAIGR